MSINIKYLCNICESEEKNINDLFGISFNGVKNNIILLDNCTSSERIHICYDCCRQLIKEFNTDKILKALRE